MAEVLLDNPGDVHWFKGYGPTATVGPCPHNCEHRALTNIAWGPDYEHYTLNECDDVCAGRCRGWQAEYPSWDPRRSFLHGFRLLAREDPNGE